MDTWNPSQYEKFKNQRSQPFWDLLNLLRPSESPSVLDLGCGTGELTRELHIRLNAQSTLGIDSSSKMLERSQAFESNNLNFKNINILDFDPGTHFDIVFSNAALQWVNGHEKLLPKILNLASQQGQIAIQMPYNFDHPSHVVAHEVAARLFPHTFKKENKRTSVLNVEKYAEILFHHGFTDQNCSIRVYAHPMSSGYDVIEWTKGTLLTDYQSKLSSQDFDFFVKEYTRELIHQIGEGPYFYGFKRMLLWGLRK